MIVHERVQWTRCQASGEGWDCDGTAQTRRYGLYCLTHYQQIHRGRPLAEIRRRQNVVEESIASLKSLGYTVTAPDGIPDWSQRPAPREATE